MQEDPNSCLVMVGSVTGNSITVGGGSAYPIVDRKQLERFKKGFDNPVAMANGYSFTCTKVYNDSTLALMVTSSFLHFKFLTR